MKSLNNLHQKQAQLVKEAFDVAEDMMKQCTIAKFRCDKNPTSVNQKRLEVLSVRSVRVVLGSIEKVNEVCQILKDNYTKIHMDSMSEKESKIDNSHDKSQLRRYNRAQSAPAKRPIIANIQNSDRKRPRSAFTRRSKSKLPFTAVSGTGKSPYKHFSNRMKARSTSRLRKSALLAESNNQESPNAEDLNYATEEFVSEVTSDRNCFEKSRGRSKQRNRSRKMKSGKLKQMKHICMECGDVFHDEGRKLREAVIFALFY